MNDTHPNTPPQTASETPSSQEQQPREPQQATEEKHFHDRPRRAPRPTGDRPFRRPLLRETLAEIDKDIVRMLAKRRNILDRMSQIKGYLDPAEERELRASWEKNARRVSRDPRLIRQMFALMQQIDFLPKPVPGEERRAFNLAPSTRPVKLQMAAPVSAGKCCAWLSLAAMSGQACTLLNTSLSDTLVSCCKLFNQLGASMSWLENGTVLSRPLPPLECPDQVLFVGDDLLNFALLAGHYLGRPSRAKFTGDGTLKLTDLSSVRRYFPELGARLANAVPGTDGFPVRLECSGVLPSETRIPADLPSEFVKGLLLAAPFWEKSMRFDISAHPAAAAIIGFCLPILRACQAHITEDGTTITVHPGELHIPETPVVPVDLTLTSSFLALAGLTEGQVQLQGSWPDCPLTAQALMLLKWFGVNIENQAETIVATHTQVQQDSTFMAQLSPKFLPLAVAFATVRALRGEPVTLPAALRTDSTIIESFCINTGLHLEEDGSLRHLTEEEATQYKDDVWTAPSPLWAIAMACAAFARPGLKITNPGILTELYPAFWTLYNALPEPALKTETETESTNDKTVRRRIITTERARPIARDQDD